MKRAFLSAFFIVFMVGLCSLSSYLDSNYFPLDTKPPVLALLEPTEGDLWYIDLEQNILWNAQDLHLDSTSVFIWYSLDGGTNYNSLADGVYSSGSFPWTPPAPPINNGRISINVHDYFHNYAQVNMTQGFSLDYMPLSAPESLRVDISNNRDAVLTWLPVTTTIFNTPITPDGYVVLHNETLSPADSLFYFLADVPDSTYTHYRVLHWRDRIFYQVFAYKDYDGRMAELLANLKLNKSEKRPWLDIIRDFRRKGGAK